MTLSSPNGISVIIPTLNRQDLLARALRSVLKQTRPADEIIVVDDGSTDHTHEMLQREFPGVHCLRQENRGVSAARNLGIKKATGPWIALLDSDDEWLPEKLQRQEAALRAAPHMKVCHTEEIWIRHGRRVNQMKKHRKYGGFIFSRCLPLCVMSPSSILLHRDVLDDVGLFDETLPACEDYELWLRICARYEVLFLDEPLINKYGGHADQLSHAFPGQMDKFRIRALEKIIRSGMLNSENHHAAIAAMRGKIRIYCLGAAKRGKQEEVAHYKKLAHWAQNQQTVQDKK